MTESLLLSKFNLNRRKIVTGYNHGGKNTPKKSCADLGCQQANDDDMIRVNAMYGGIDVGYNPYYCLMLFLNIFFFDKW